MSRTQAAGKQRWKKKRLVQTGHGAISRKMTMDWLARDGVEFRGAGVDESPHAYRSLPDVLASHSGSIDIVHTLMPIGVAMTGADDWDPYRD